MQPRFRVGLAISEGEDLIAEAWRAARAGGLFPGHPAACSRRSSRTSRPGQSGPPHPGALAVPRQHTLSRFQLSEFTHELFALRVDPRERFADPFSLVADLVNIAMTYLREDWT